MNIFLYRKLWFSNLIYYYLLIIFIICDINYAKYNLNIFLFIIICLLIFLVEKYQIKGNL